MFKPMFKQSEFFRIYKIEKYLKIMNVEMFFNEFKKEISSLMREDVIGIEDTLRPGIFTFLFNVAMYKIAKKNHLRIFPERAVGRGLYSDIALYTKDKKEFIIEIEHENEPFRKGGLKYILTFEKELIKLLFHSKAKYKILITYRPERFTSSRFEKIIKERFDILNVDNVTNVYLFYIKEEFGPEEIEEFKMIKLS